MEKQRTFDGRLVPVAPHRDDIIETEDGALIRYGDIEFVDCRGRAFSNEELRDDSNDSIVSELLDSRDEWIGDYVASDDYGDSYAYVVCEDGAYRWRDRIDEWLEDNHSNYSVELSRELINGIIENLDDSDLEAHYDPNEYACWHGSGCDVDSLEVGEYEDQISISDYPEFEALHKDGLLLDCLNRYNGNLCINVYGIDLSSDYPCFYGYSNGWGRWHYVFSDESMERALNAAICDYCRRTDGSNK